MKIAVPYFDGAEIALQGAEADDPALVAFLARGASDRLAEARHVFNHYREYHYLERGQDWLDAQMGVVEGAEDIWAHVKPRTLLVKSGPGADTARYVVLEADIPWDEEHGLMMVWQGGEVLCKVSGYDGHVRNGTAAENVVYHGEEERFTTYRDTV